MEEGIGIKKRSPTTLTTMRTPPLESALFCVDEEISLTVSHTPNCPWETDIPEICFLPYLPILQVREFAITYLARISHPGLFERASSTSLNQRILHCYRKGFLDTHHSLLKDIRSSLVTVAVPTTIGSILTCPVFKLS
jgi:hypothetical protein